MTNIVLYVSPIHMSAFPYAPDSDVSNELNIMKSRQGAQGTAPSPRAAQQPATRRTRGCFPFPPRCVGLCCRRRAAGPAGHPPRRAGHRCASQRTSGHAEIPLLVVRLLCPSFASSSMSVICTHGNFDKGWLRREFCYCYTAEFDLTDNWQAGRDGFTGTVLWI